MKHFLLLGILAAGVAGCATHPIPVQDATPVPAERILAFNTSVDGPHGGLTIIRDQGNTMRLCPMAFTVDGRTAALVRAGEVVELSVPVGSHLLGAAPAGDGICSWGNAAARRREITQIVTDGSKAKIRLGVTPDGIVQIMPTAF